MADERPAVSVLMRRLVVFGNPFMILRHHADRAWVLGLLGLLVLVMSGCGRVSRPWGDIHVAGGQPIRIGLLTDVDGSVSPATGPATLMAGQTVRGHAVEIVPIPVHCGAGAAQDSAPDPAALSGLSGVIGSGCSAACVYTESLLADTKTTLLAAGCTASAVVGQGYSTVFRLAWDDRDQAIVSADYARSPLQARRATVITDGSDEARALRTAFSTRFLSRGGEAVSQVGVGADGTVDVSSVVQQVRQQQPGVVFLALSRPDTGALFEQFQAVLPETMVIATDSVFLGASDGQIPHGLVAAGLARQNGNWTSELDAGPLSPQLFSGQLLDAVRAYASAIDKVGRPEPGGAITISRQALRNSLAGLDLSGSTGRISFNSKGDRKHDVGAALYRLGDGAPALLKTYER